MTIAELLEKVGQQGIELWLEGEELRFRAPKGALTPELRDLIVGRKPEIIAHLKQQAQTSVIYAPLSFGQQSMWIIHQMSPESAAYNVVFAARICSPIDVPIMKHAWQTIVDRHPMLRTTYLLKDGAPVQAIHGTSEISLETIDVSGMTSDVIDQAVKAASEQPVDLEHGPLFRIYLFTRSAEDHILLMVTHHIAVDGWSLWLILDDFHLLYPAYIKGETVSLPRPESAYKDYVGWLDNLVNGANGANLRSYWHGNLSGDLAPLALPTDHPRPPLPTFNGASAMFLIDESLTRRLREQARAEGATIYMFLMAAFEVLLYRYSGQQEILVGSPTFGRSRPEFSSIVGHFVNMVTLRGDFAGSPSFKQALSQMRTTVLEALDHQDYPFMLLAQALDHSRDASRSSIFQATFDLQRLQQNRTFSNLFAPDKTDVRVELGSLIAEPYTLSQQEGQFDLSLQIVEVQDTLPGALKYNTDLFDHATIERMGQHFITLLESILDNMDTPVDQLRLMPEKDTRQILVEWNTTRVDYPQNVAVHQLFEAQVERTPDATAAIYEAQSLTYRQLNQRANQLAHYLRTLNITPNTLVGICMERSLDMLVALLGVLKAGGAYVPMDPEYPQERLGFMVEDAQMPIIITQQTLMDRLPANQSQIIRMDSDWDQVAGQSQENPVPQQSGENLAYVIFTSGSTGRPKGVQLPHRALTNFLLSTQREPGMSASDVLVSVTTLSFDIAGLELYLPLISGAAVVIASRDTIIDGVALAALLDSSHATVMQATPATWRLMIDSGWKGRAGLKMLCGGEGLPRKLMHQLLERGAELWNMYGPTETTIWSTVSHLQASDPIITIGRPMANTQVYVLNDRLAPVPVGALGTLYIGGDGLAHGYIGRPDLTDERFIPNPFDASLGRIYNTGDQARWLPDGRLECLGRVDHQVKVRGFRIELGEIEAALAAYSGITQAVVIVREDRPGDQQLVGYVVADPPPAVSDIRAALRARLPAYMIPSAFVMLNKLPLTPNGKIDRRALPPPDQHSKVVREDTAVAARTPMETLMVEVWQEVLGLDQVSVYDNFFDLGGHSLKVMEVIGKLEDKSGLRINPAFMRLQTLGQLASSYDELKAQGLTATPKPEPADSAGLGKRLLKGLFQRGNES